MIPKRMICISLTFLCVFGVSESVFSQAPQTIPYYSEWTKDSTPTLSWYAVSGASNYQIAIDDDPSFTAPIILDHTNGSTTYTPGSPLPLGVIWWKVSSSLNYNIYSETDSFEILFEHAPYIIPCTPDPTSNRKPRLEWSEVAGATHYFILIDSTPAFDSPFINKQTGSSGQDTFFIPSNDLPYGSIYWRVSSSYDSSQFSMPDQFEIINFEPACIARWSFDKGSGDSIYDSSGNNHNGYIHGATWTSGYNGNALRFDGDDFVQVANHPQLDIQKNITIVALIRPSIITGNHTIISKSDGSTLGYDIACNPSGNAYGRVGGAGNSNRYIMMNSPVLNNEWQDLALTFDGHTSKLYYSGELVASKNVDDSSGIVPHDLCIGKMADRNGDNFIGDIDELAIYNCALSATDISNLSYRPDTLSQEPRLVAYWSFDEGSGDTVSDAQGHNGFINGANWTNGIDGKALNFDGIDDYVEITGNPGDLRLQKYTIMAWIKPHVLLREYGAAYMADMFVYSTIHSNPSLSKGNCILFRDGKLTSSKASGGVGSWCHNQLEVPVMDGKWHQVAVSFDGTQQRLYYDGEPVLIWTCPEPVDYDNTAPTIGANPDQHISQGYFNGVIDEIVVYDQALHPDTVAQFYSIFASDTSKQLEINLGMKTAYAQPGQELWMPVYITNYEDYIEFNACQFTMNIDTAVVTFLEASKDSGIVSDWMLSCNEGAGNSINFALGGISTSLGYSEGELLRCKFRVKHQASGGSFSNLIISDIIVDESGLVTATSTLGRIIVDTVDVLYGDITGNRIVNAFDGAYILEHIVGNLMLPDPAVPNFTTMVADVSGNGAITSFDAALIFQHSVGLIPVFPVEQRSMGKVLSVMETASGTLQLVLNESTNQNEIAVDMRGRNLKGYVAGEFGVRYNPSLVNVDIGGDASSPLRGHNLAMGIDKPVNKFKIALAVNDDIDDNQELTLLTLTVPRKGTEDPTSALSLVSAEINEGAIPTNIPLGNLVGLKQGYSADNSGNIASRNMTMLFNNRILIWNDAKKPVSLSIYDLKGRLVFNDSFAPQARFVSIPLEQLSSGMYIYKIMRGSQPVVRHFIHNRK
ncbi:MAG: T9SS type A sorting domain-containing protein [Chitinivibrionales bacterium]|nr:T9SS type A sorting domain-containing protein [Chitinivibrionales bacterium]